MYFFLIVLINFEINMYSENLPALCCPNSSSACGKMMIEHMYMECNLQQTIVR